MEVKRKYKEISMCLKSTSIIKYKINTWKLLYMDALISFKNTRPHTGHNYQTYPTLTFYTQVFLKSTGIDSIGQQELISWVLKQQVFIGL